MNKKLCDMIGDAIYCIVDNSDNMDVLIEYVRDILSNLIMYLHPTAKEVLIERIRMLLDELE